MAKSSELTSISENEDLQIFLIIDKFTFRKTIPHFRIARLRIWNTVKCFAISGDLIRFTDRKQLTEKIHQMGGRVTARVSDTTDYLICNVDDFDGLKDAISLSEEAWEMTYTGNFLEFVADNGI